MKHLLGALALVACSGGGPGPYTAEASAGAPSVDSGADSGAVAAPYEPDPDCELMTVNTIAWWECWQDCGDQACKNEECPAQAQACEDYPFCETRRHPEHALCSEACADAACQASCDFSWKFLTVCEVSGD